MLKITEFTVEHLSSDCVTDSQTPRFTFVAESDNQNVKIVSAVFSVNDWEVATESNFVYYSGQVLSPFTRYQVDLSVTDNFGGTATAQTYFETGRLSLPWQAAWISDKSYVFNGKGNSPIPMTFKKAVQPKKSVAKATVFVTALGVYQLKIDGKKVGKDYFTPGFTSYKSNLQYQVYDVTKQLKNGGAVTATVAGGWAVGAFVFTRKNRVYGDRQALLAEIRIVYEDGSEEVVGTDESWLVTEDGHIKEADLYDGEMFDATFDEKSIVWRNSSVERLRINPVISATYGSLVCEHEVFKPVSVKEVNGGLIYDFGQNFAGIVKLKINGKAGQQIVVKHAEVLHKNGSLNLEFLRSAKATLTYVCKEGKQTYSPVFTYMGFRYAEIRGIDEKDVEVSAVALYSDIKQIGSFSCSNDKLNRLNENIVWSAKSNFMDIPTDCPQRDERMGWTGDIAVFAPTACYNFDISRFLEKWLADVRSEQLKSGGLPNTIPANGYGFPATMPTMAVDFWGDACVLVPWAEYMARGDKEILTKMYPTMKKYVKACLFWAGLFSFGKRRYVWHTPSILHFGDWVAPDLPQMGQWQARSKWTATASLKNTSATVAKIANILGEKKDAAFYSDVSQKVADAYLSVFTDGNGKMKNEFQTAYVLPLQFGIFNGEQRKVAALALAEVVRKANWCVGTGFPGTPYVLFALADNGQEEAAFKMLLNEKCPSWLYEVKVGATTVWERWDGLDENGECPIGDSGTADVMISYNHYAGGSVGAFLYNRVLGIEQLSAGYKLFRVKPVLGGGITYAEGGVETPYGKIRCSWKIENGVFSVSVDVPVGTACVLCLPNGEKQTTGSGSYCFSVTL